MQQTPLRDQPRGITHTSMCALQHRQTGRLAPPREHLVEFHYIGVGEDEIACCRIVDRMRGA